MNASWALPILKCSMDEIGQRLRELRQQRGWTLKRLSEKCDLSVSFLSQVERGLSSTSITSLHIICQALGITLGELFADLGTPVDSVVGAGGTERVTHAGEPVAISLSNAAIKYRFLSRHFPERRFEIMIGEISPGYTYPPASHEGEEFGYVLEGKLRLALGDEEYILGPGDSYHFPSHTPHGYQVDGEEPTKVLWVQTLKYFQNREGIPSMEAAPRVTTQR